MDVVEDPDAWITRSSLLCRWIRQSPRVWNGILADDFCTWIYMVTFPFQITITSQGSEGHSASIEYIQVRISKKVKKVAGHVPDCLVSKQGQDLTPVKRGSGFPSFSWRNNFWCGFRLRERVRACPGAHAVCHSLCIEPRGWDWQLCVKFVDRGISRNLLAALFLSCPRNQIWWLYMPTP